MKIFKTWLKNHSRKLVPATALFRTCIVCGDSCSHGTKQTVRTISNETTKSQIIQLIVDQKQKSVFAKTVLARLSSVDNLVNQKAIYNAACMAAFYSKFPSSNVGRPASQSTKDFIGHVINHVDNNEQ